MQKAIYKDNAETILGNMDSVVFLGGRGKLHHQGNIRKLVGKATISMQTEGPLLWAVGKLQPEHPAAGPGADDTQRAGYHAGR